MKHLTRTIILAIMLLISACRAPATTRLPTPTPDTRGLFEIITTLPGDHLSLSTQIQDDFLPASLEDIYRHHWNHQDFWLLATDESIATAEDGKSLLPWLQSAHALRFEDEQGVVWFVPAHGADETYEELINGIPVEKTIKGTDLLAFILDHHLQLWADPQQLARLWLQKGNTLRRDTFFQESIEAYNHAVALDPTLDEAYVGIGAALLGQGKPQQALTPLLQAVKLNPDSYWAQQLLGNAYLKLQRYELAVTPLTRAYQLKPENSKILIGIALSLGRSGHQQQALKILDEARFKLSDSESLGAMKALQHEFSEK